MGATAGDHVYHYWIVGTVLYGHILCFIHQAAAHIHRLKGSPKC